MTTAALIGYVMCFLVGPGVFAALQTWRWGRGTAAVLAALVAVLCLFALTPPVTETTNPAIVTLLALWGAWVLTLTLLARAFDLRLPSASDRRLAAFTFLLATPLPWFGLATATSMSI